MEAVPLQRKVIHTTLWTRSNRSNRSHVHHLWAMLRFRPLPYLSLSVNPRNNSPPPTSGSLFKRSDLHGKMPRSYQQNVSPHTRNTDCRLMYSWVYRMHQLWVDYSPFKKVLIIPGCDQQRLIRISQFPLPCFKLHTHIWITQFPAQLSTAHTVSTSWGTMLRSVIEVDFEDLLSPKVSIYCCRQYWHPAEKLMGGQEAAVWFGLFVHSVTHT